MKRPASAFMGTMSMKGGGSVRPTSAATLINAKGRKAKRGRGKTNI